LPSSRSWAQAGSSSALIPLFASRSTRLGELAARYAMPRKSLRTARSPQPAGLASYGSDALDSYRLTGVYVARILKGEKPADLPVQQGTNSNCSSTQNPPRRSGSPFRCPCQAAPTR